MTALSLFSISYLRKREWPGDPPGHGKMWENQFFTLKIWISGPKPAKIDYCTCWGRVWPFQISITYTIEVRGAPFPQVIFQTPRTGHSKMEVYHWRAVKHDDPHFHWASHSDSVFSGFPLIVWAKYFDIRGFCSFHFLMAYNAVLLSTVSLKS